MLAIPHVVDNHQTIPPPQFLPELIGSVLNTRKAGTFTSKRRKEREQTAQYIGRLAEGHPQDAVIEVRDDVLVVT